MKHFLEKYKNYEGSNQDIIVYATELSYSKELAGNLEDRYDDMLEMLDGELEEQRGKEITAPAASAPKISPGGPGKVCTIPLKSDNPMYDSDTEHLLCDNEIL